MSGWSRFGGLEEYIRQQCDRHRTSHVGGDLISGLSYNDAMCLLQATRLGGSNDPTWAAIRTNLWGWKFSKTTEQELFWAIQLPHSYLEGTDLALHVHWTTAAATATGTVTWGVDYSVAKITGTFGASTNAEATYTFAANQQYKHLLTDIVTVTGTGLTISSILMGRFYRKAASDTHDEDVFALSLDVHHQVDAHGSTTASVK